MKVNQLGTKTVLPSCILIVVRENNQSNSHFLGMKVSKKLGNAVVRNKIKRRIRHLFRLVIAEFGNSHSFTTLVIPKKNFATINFAKLRQLWQEVFANLAVRF